MVADVSEVEVAVAVKRLQEQQHIAGGTRRREATLTVACSAVCRLNAYAGILLSWLTCGTQGVLTRALGEPVAGAASTVATEPSRLICSSG